MLMYIIIITATYIIHHKHTHFKYEVVKATGPTKKLKVISLYTKKIRRIYCLAAFHYFT